MSVDVNFFFHQTDRDATGELRGHVAGVCEERGWQFHPRSVTMMRAPDGRPIPLIARDVAAGLYPRLHRSRVATLVMGKDPRVPLHPREADALRFRRHIPLILIPFQDETNNATLSSWQDHEEPMSSWSHPLGRLCSKPRTSGNYGKPWRCCSQRS